MVVPCNCATETGVGPHVACSRKRAAARSVMIGETGLWQSAADASSVMAAREIHEFGPTFDPNTGRAGKVSLRKINRSEVQAVPC